MAAAGWGKEQGIVQMAGKLSGNVQNEHHMTIAVAVGRADAVTTLAEHVSIKCIK